MVGGIIIERGYATSSGGGGENRGIWLCHNKIYRIPPISTIM